MRLEKAVGWAVFVQAVAPGLALPVNHTDDQVGAVVDAGTFQNPSVNVRPRFRYWLPDASADLATVVDDIKEIGRVGASGFELIGMYLYGGPPAGFGTYAPVDWSVYGWGTDAWHTLFKTFAQATKDNGLLLDFAMGPSQGQGVPAEYDDDGKAWDLSVVKTTLKANGSFDGVIPGWGSGPLEAVTLAGTAVGGAAKSVVATTLQDLTANVTTDGHLTLSSVPSGNYTWTLFTVYLIHSQWQAQDSPLLMQGPQTAPESWIQNGSWAVDHFSRRGAQMATKFFEDHVLIDGVRELIQEIGNYAWEDSVELRQTYRWTKGLLDRFETEHHYSLRKFLPVIFGYKTDQWDAGERYTMDYRTTLANGYGEFLDEYTKWANDYLNIQYSCQVSYGMSLDELQNIPYVNAPEDESLEFANEIDRYRQYAGPANLAGKRVISNELGAVIYQAFQQTIPMLLDIFAHAISGGVNQVVIHGSSYSGDYPNTTWPGIVTFAYEFSENHNRHQPAWEDYPDFLNYIARNQYIFQLGIPRRDVVFWEKRYWFPGNTSYAETDLLAKGYTYEYLSPENFNLPEAQVSDGVFAPNRQAFKVLVVRTLDYLTLPGVRKLADYAHAGLPIIFEGGIPTRLWAYHKCDAQAVTKIMNQLATLDNVHVIDSNVADHLASIGIEPRTKVSSTGDWYTVWREDPRTGAEYIFVYNYDNATTSGTIEFASTKTPYWYDAWTGEQTPIALYEQSTSGTTIPFTLYGNQTKIIAFLEKPLGDVPKVHVASASEEILSVTASNTSVSVKAGTKAGQVKTSDGATHDIAGTQAQPIDLKPWNLTVEHWDHPEDLYDVKTAAVKSNTTHELATLVSWQQIDGLQDTSGRGYYSAKFQWPPAGGADGAFIDFGRIFHTLTASVNGQKLPPFDVSFARADIGPYLKDGENDVEVVVATTMINGLRPIWDQLESSATTALKKIPPAQDYGLTQPVIITPYKETLI